MPAPIAAASAARIAEALATLGAAAEAARPLGVLGGAVLAILGLSALTVATRFRRALAVLGGAAVGALAALAVQGFLAAHLGLSPVLAVALGAVAGGAGCGLYPIAFPIAAGALPAALLGYGVPLAGRALLGAAAGGLLGAVIGAGFARIVAATFACLLGGAALALGLVVALAGWAPAQQLAGRPLAIAAAAVVLAVAGAAFQLRAGDGRPSRGPSPLRAPDR